MCEHNATGSFTPHHADDEPEFYSVQMNYQPSRINSNERRGEREGDTIKESKKMKRTHGDSSSGAKGNQIIYGRYI
jgi:hypothetical protein